MTTAYPHLRDGVVFAFLVAIATALRLLLRALSNYRLSKRAENPKAGALLRRQAVHRGSARGVFVRYSILSAVLVVLYQSGAWNAISIGLTRRESLTMAVVAGVFLYYPLLYAYGIVTLLFKQQAAEQRAGLHVTFRNLPRNRVERCVAVGIVCLVNPVVEEVIFRGLLVHQSALLTGNLPRALAVGALVNALNHGYQGWRAAPFHLVFYGAAVSLMYSSYGLAAAIALHYAADAVPLLGLKERLAAYRKARRAMRVRPTAA